MLYINKQIYERNLKEREFESLDGIYRAQELD
jgi:hypothetical protein